MNVFIATLGSRGDVQPYIALGHGLRAAGHAVTICTSVRFQALVEGHGFAYAYLNDDLVGLLDTDVGRGAMEDMGSLFKGVRTGLRMLREAGPMQRALIREGWEAARAAEPDVILYHVKMGGALHYAEKLGVPAVLTSLFPQFVPTRAFPTVGFPQWPLGGAYNRGTYRFVLGAARRVGTKYVAEWRAAHGLAPVPPGIDLLHRTDGAPVPVLHAVSPHVVPTPPDWPASAESTGFWFLDHDPDWTPPPDLERFLADGPPPVYVGFGSMAGRDPARTARTVVQALRRAGVRGVLATGWGGLDPTVLGDDLFRLDAAPHDWLFPRMAAVVHHGGAGTTAAGLRAGRPTVVCPFFGDQPFWGARVHALGAGPPPIPQKRITPERLADAVRAAATDPAMAAAAGALGERIRTERGVARAVERIEQLAGRA